MWLWLWVWHRDPPSKSVILKNNLLWYSKNDIFVWMPNRSTTVTKTSRLLVFHRQNSHIEDGSILRFKNSHEWHTQSRLLLSDFQSDTETRPQKESYWKWRAFRIPTTTSSFGYQIASVSMTTRSTVKKTVILMMTLILVLKKQTRTVKVITVRLRVRLFNDYLMITNYT